MLCSVFCGMPAKAQEIKDSDSQKIGGVESSSNNEGDKNLKEKNRTKNKVSRFVDLVIDHPTWSIIIGGGTVATEEGIKRKFFPGKWGVDKFGYNKDDGLIYRKSSGKINVVILGTNEHRKEFISDLKSNEYNLQEAVIGKLLKKGHHTSAGLNLTNERVQFEKWNIIEKEYNYEEDMGEKYYNELSDELKNDMTAMIVLHKTDPYKVIANLNEKIKLDFKGIMRNGTYYENKQLTPFITIIFEV